MQAFLLDWAERGLLPDTLIRFGIRQLLRDRLRSLPADLETAMEAREALLAAMRRAPVALSTSVANEQHYEVPTDYFRQCLGPHLKYSCGLWATPALVIPPSQALVDTGPGTLVAPVQTPGIAHDLAAAEARMLALTCQRAGIEDGQRILELGCGWGSLSLWMAEHYPGSQILAVSNSATQRAFIEQCSAERGLGNLQVVTADMNHFAAELAAYDRVVSVEMFEHLRNWPVMLQRVSTWLRPGGYFFLHVFCHRHTAYFFDSAGTDDWMGRYFFRDGLMPADDMLRSFQEHLQVIRQWRVNGQHYAQTCDAWLQRQDDAREALFPLFRATYGVQADRWWQRWRMFYMACAELFAYRQGQEWFVSHSLWQRPTPA